MDSTGPFPDFLKDNPHTMMLVYEKDNDILHINSAVQKEWGLPWEVPLYTLCSIVDSEQCESLSKWISGSGDEDSVVYKIRKERYRFHRYIHEESGLVTVHPENLSEIDMLSYQISEYAEGIVNNTVGLELSKRELEERNRELQEELRARQLSQELLNQSLENQKRIIDEMIHTLSLIGIIRDPYTGTHQYRVALLSKAIAEHMDLHTEQIQGIYTAAMLHDIGKISIPSEILSKPGNINDIEMLLIRSHPRISYDILKQVEFPWPVARIAYQHHEKLDGSGYPQGLRGDDILLESQIIGVADVVEAVSSHRPYRAGLGIELAIKMIKEKQGREYRKDVVEACLEIFESGMFEFPEDSHGLDIVKMTETIMK